MCGRPDFRAPTSHSHVSTGRAACVQLLSASLRLVTSGRLGCLPAARASNTRVSTRWCRTTGTTEDAAGGDSAQQMQPDAGAAGKAQRDEAKAAAVVAGQRQQLPLGVRNSAMAVPDGGGQPEDVLLYFGIIDILQVRSPQRDACSACLIKPSSHEEQEHLFASQRKGCVFGGSAPRHRQCVICKSASHHCVA